MLKKFWLFIMVRYSYSSAFSLIAFVTLFVIAGPSLAETINVESSPETIQSSVHAMILAIKAIATKLTEPDSVLFGLASVMWRALAFILLVWLIISWIFLSKDFLQLFLGLLAIFLTGAMIYIPISGEPAFVYISVAFFEGFLQLSSELFFQSMGTSGAGKSLWDAVGFVIGLSSKLEFDYDVSVFGRLGAAVAVSLTQLIFILMAALAFVVTLTAQFGAGLLIGVGLIFIPLLLFPFGVQLFYMWLKSFLAFLFTLMFVGLIMALVLYGLLEFIGVPATSIDESFWDDDTVVIVHATSVKNIIISALLPFIGLIALSQAFSWGSMLAGAGVPTGGGRNAAIGARLLWGSK